MKSGYKILWTDHALSELVKTIEYLESNFPGKQLEKLSQKIESIVSLISQNPRLFSKSDKKSLSGNNSKIQHYVLSGKR